MKSIIKNGLSLVVCFIFLGQAFATSGNLNKKEVRTLVKNSDGAVVYSVTKALNLNSMAEFLTEGDYTIEEDNGLAITVTPLTITDEQVIVEEAESYQIFKPVINEEGDYVLFSRLSLNKESMHVRVYDTRNKLVYKETIKGEVESNRVFDFSELDNGNYKIVVKATGRTFKNVVTIK